jgi:hypothetical protein
MSTTRFETQPARAELRRQRWTIKLASRVIAVPEQSLRNAVLGRAAPSPEVRGRLAILLGRDEHELFTPEALAAAAKRVWR